ncbi:MAG: hypothetical protein MZU84_08110 [Sphingobacterium sp.]|nr:hypothetical protein [Sphingobacterium sp.]
METRLAKFVQEFPGRLALPIASCAGLEITGESVEDLVSVPGSQFKAIMALADRYRTPVMLTAIDTTAEAEAYGCEIKFSTREAPDHRGPAGHERRRSRRAPRSRRRRCPDARPHRDRLAPDRRSGGVRAGPGRDARSVRAGRRASSASRRRSRPRPPSPRRSRRSSTT